MHYRTEAYDSKVDKMIFFYQGNSMKGTFRTVDFLTIEPCNLKNLRIGDIIAFTKDNEEDNKDDLVVHRIIRVGEGHLSTKGDNNRRPDILPVSASNLIGKVVAFERKGKTYRVRNGIAGLIRARMGYVFRRICYLLICKVRRHLPVKKIRNIIFILWKPEIQKIKFSTTDGPLIKWVHRNRTIATWLPEKNLLKASFLSRFLINQKNLN
jgi:signal peptidase I